MEASSFGFRQMACVFKAIINPQFHRPGTFKEWLVIRNKLNDTGTNVGAKVQSSF